MWTVLFVIVNQAAYVVVVWLASGGTASAADGTGITIYSSAFLVVMVPHSIITVSLATAILPRLSAHAAARDDAALASTLVRTIRTALVVVVPFAPLLPFIALPMSQVLWGHGAAADIYPRFESTVALFGFGIVFFTIHYLTLRGFYALELNRTVFLIQCVISAVNIAAAIVLVGNADPGNTSPMLVLGYTAAYGVGSLLSFTVLARRLGGLQAGSLLGFAARLLVASAIGAGAAWVVSLGLDAAPRTGTGAGGLVVVRGRRRRPGPGRGWRGGAAGAGAQAAGGHHGDRHRGARLRRELRLAADRRDSIGSSSASPRCRRGSALRWKCRRLERKKLSRARRTGG